eukprot:5055930-Prymnesium_polylepis.1
MREAQITGKYYCSEVFLFGLCTPRTDGTTCTRCSAVPVAAGIPAVVPPGARAAITAACTDPAVAASILAG